MTRTLTILLLCILCGCATQPAAVVSPQAGQAADKQSLTAPLPPMPQGGFLVATPQLIVQQPPMLATNVVAAFFRAQAAAYGAGTMTTNALAFFASSPDLQTWTTILAVPYPEFGTWLCCTDITTAPYKFYIAGINPTGQ